LLIKSFAILPALVKPLPCGVLGKSAPLPDGVAGELLEHAVKLSRHNPVPVRTSGRSRRIDRVAMVTTRSGSRNGWLMPPSYELVIANGTGETRAVTTFSLRPCEY